MRNKNIMTILPGEVETPATRSHGPQIIETKAEKSLLQSLLSFPKTIIKGLLGSPDFTFSDKMKLTKIPYVLGGLFLIAGFAAGRNKVETVRQGVAVALYFIGVAISRKLIDKTYLLKYGVDLNMTYRSPLGQEDKVFASADFPRFDLLREEHYQRFAKGFNIPRNLNDPYGAINERLKAVIVQSQAFKIIIGNLAGVLGAAFFARTSVWARSAEKLSTLSGLIREPRLRLSNKFQMGLTTISNILLDPLLSCLKPRSMSKPQRLILYGAIAFGLYSFYKALQLNREHKNTAKTDPYSVDWQFAEALNENRGGNR